MGHAMDGDGEVRTGGDPFEEWLNERLRSWGADEAVLGGYLCGLLADGDPPADQREALVSILQDIIVRTYVVYPRISYPKCRVFNVSSFKKYKLLNSKTNSK